MISAGCPQDALEPLLTAVELEPGFFDPHVHLGELYAQLGRYDDAVAAGQRGLALTGRSAHALQALAIIYARAGRIEDAAPLIEELESHPTQQSAWDMAMIHLAADRRDRAFYWLRRACVDPHRR
jgi:Flp pilus assembly protein TadD